MTRTARTAAALTATAVLTATLGAACTEGGDDPADSFRPSSSSTVLGPDGSTPSSFVPGAGVTSTTLEVDIEPEPVVIDRIPADELCIVLSPRAVGEVLGVPVEARPGTNVCEYRFDGGSLRLQEYTGVISELDERAGESLASALNTWLLARGETGLRTVAGVGDGAFQLDDGPVFVVTGGNVLLLDLGPGALPGGADPLATLYALAEVMAPNLGVD